MARFFKMSSPDRQPNRIEKIRIESMGQEGCSHYANGEYRFLEGPSISLGRLARAIIIAAIMNAGEYLYLQIFSSNR